jgi:murein DD-endopeptidase MepM/ murein hydrolase activator NlpD
MQASPPNAFMTAPRVIVLSQLFVCNPSATNVRLIDADGAASEYTPYMHTPAGDLLRNPTQGACLSSGFGLRPSAMGGDVGSAHTGIDLARRDGGFVFAAGDGRITSAGWRGAYGLTIEIDHGAGVRTLYAHLAEIDPRLTIGSWVTAGSAIARMGRTGNATGIHLHYEVAIGNMKVDPLGFEMPPPS